MLPCTNHRRCQKQALNVAQQICDDQSLRLTDIRKKVLEIIWENHQPSKAYDILDQLSSLEPSAKPPTVYRALDFLLEAGLIHKINSLNAYIGCSHPLEHSQCYFLICHQCGDLSECCNDQLHKMINQTASKQAFKIDKAVVEINGYCQHCVNNEQSKK